MKQILKQFIKFGLVGTSSAIVDFAILNLLVLIFHLNVYLSATISFVLAVTNGFIWNRLWTFKSEGVKTLEYSKFMFVNIIGLGMNLGIMFVLIQYFGLWYNFAKAVAIVIVMFWNFYASKRWVFEESSKIKYQSAK